MAAGSGSRGFRAFGRSAPLSTRRLLAADGTGAPPPCRVRAGGGRGIPPRGAPAERRPGLRRALPPRAVLRVLRLRRRLARPRGALSRALALLLLLRGGGLGLFWALCSWLHDGSGGGGGAGRRGLAARRRGAVLVPDVLLVLSACGRGGERGGRRGNPAAPRAALPRGPGAIGAPSAGSLLAVSPPSTSAPNASSSFCGAARAQPGAGRCARQLS